MKTELHSIQAARGIAALMVLALHSYLLDTKYLSSDVIPSFAELGHLGVDVFFVISGFVMAMTTGHAHRNSGNISRFIFKRLTRIYPIYWFYFFLLMPIVLYVPGIVNASQDEGPNIFRSFFLLPDNQVPLLLVAWTLVYELWFYAVFAIFLCFSRKTLPYLLVGWAVVLVALNGFIPQSAFLRIAIGPYALEFILGAFAYLATQRFPSTKGDAALCIGLMAMAGCVIVWPAIFKDQSASRMLAFGAPTALALFGLVKFEKSGRFPKSRLIESLGNSSYSLYLSHLLVLSALCRIATMFFGDYLGTPIAGWSFWFLSALIAIVWGFVSYYFVELPLLRAARNLMSKRMLLAT